VASIVADEELRTDTATEDAATETPADTTTSVPRD
jgi:hypothetical protein